MTRIAHSRRGLVRDLSLAAVALLMLAIAPSREASAMSLITPSVSPLAKQTSEGLTTEVRGGHGGGHGGGGTAAGMVGGMEVGITAVAVGTEVGTVAGMEVGVAAGTSITDASMAATIPITITPTAGSSGPTGDRAGFAAITTGTDGIAAGIGTVAIGDGLRRRQQMSNRNR